MGQDLIDPYRKLCQLNRELPSVAGASNSFKDTQHASSSPTIAYVVREDWVSLRL